MPPSGQPWPGGRTWTGHHRLHQRGMSGRAQITSDTRGHGEDAPCRAPTAYGFRNLAIDAARGSPPSGGHAGPGLLKGAGSAGSGRQAHVRCNGTAPLPVSFGNRPITPPLVSPGNRQATRRRIRSPSLRRTTTRRQGPLVRAPTATASPNRHGHLCVASPDVVHHAPRRRRRRVDIGAGGRQRPATSGPGRPTSRATRSRS